MCRRGSRVAVELTQAYTASPTHTAQVHRERVILQITEHGSLSGTLSTHHLRVLPSILVLKCLQWRTLLLPLHLHSGRLEEVKFNENVFIATG